MPNFSAVVLCRLPKFAVAKFCYFIKIVDIEGQKCYNNMKYQMNFLTSMKIIATRISVECLLYKLAKSEPLNKTRSGFV